MTPNTTPDDEPPPLELPPPVPPDEGTKTLFRAKLQRKIMFLFFGIGLLATIFFIVTTKGVDLGQAEENKKTAEKKQQEKAKNIQERVVDPEKQAKNEYEDAKKEADARGRSEDGASLPPPPSQGEPTASGSDEVKRASEEIRSKNLGDAARMVGDSLSDSERESVGLDGTKRKGEGESGSKFVLYVRSSSGKGGALFDLKMSDPPAKPAGGRPSSGQPQTNGQNQGGNAGASPASSLKSHNDKVLEEKVVTATLVQGTHWLAGGTAIQAVLLNAIDTRSPSNVTARVTVPVFDSRYGRYEVIPAGSTLIGAMSATVANGAETAGILLSTLITPAGGHVALNGARATNSIGIGGVDGEYHSLFWPRMGMAAVMAVGAGIAEKYDKQGTTTTTNGGVTTSSPAESAAMKILSGAAKREVDTVSARQPYVTVEAGHVITIITSGSIEIPPVASTR